MIRLDSRIEPLEECDAGSEVSDACDRGHGSVRNFDNFARCSAELALSNEAGW
jgi:hypothetical protein